MKDHMFLVYYIANSLDNFTVFIELFKIIILMSKISFFSAKHSTEIFSKPGTFEYDEAKSQSY